MAPEAANIFNVADQLRAARKKQKLSIDAVAKEICVRTYYLDAIEDSRFSDLPGKTFATGFVKSYAKIVKLDPRRLSQQFMSEYSEYFAEAQSETEPLNSSNNIQLAVPKKRRWPAWVSPVIGLAGASMSWFLVGANSSVTSVAAIDPAVEERTLAEFAGPAPVQKDSLPVVQSPGNPASGVADADVMASSDLKPSSDAYTASSIFMPAAHASNYEPNGEVTSSITFEAVEDSWVQLSYGDGTELWSGVLRSGQSYQPQLVGEVFLTTSNAGGIVLKQRDATLGPLGERGHVIKSMALDASVFEVQSFSETRFSGGQTGGSD